MMARKSHSWLVLCPMQSPCSDFLKLIHCGIPSAITRLSTFQGLFFYNSMSPGFNIRTNLSRYNVINNWDYVGVAKAFDNGAGHVIASRVSSYPNPHHSLITGQYDFIHDRCLCRQTTPWQKESMTV